MRGEIAGHLGVFVLIVNAMTFMFALALFFSGGVDYGLLPLAVSGIALPIWANVKLSQVLSGAPGRTLAVGVHATVLGACGVVAVRMFSTDAVIGVLTVAGVASLNILALTIVPPPADPSLCPTCCYPLKGLPGPICPECGREIEKATP